MKITIDDIRSEGEIPESFNSIAPGKAVFYASADGVEEDVKERVLQLYEECASQRDDFMLKIEVETTTNVFLENCIVARRLNLGSLLQYNLLIARLNCTESADAFVKEFFNLYSRDDEPLKFINKRKARPVQSFDDDYSSFSSTSMLQMIVMRPRIEEEDAEEDETESLPEPTEGDDKLIQEILNFAYRKNEEMALELLERVSPRIYTKGDCKLLFTDDFEFLLKAGTTVKLDLSKREAALYLFLLAHPKGIEKKRISEYKEELTDYYFYLHKKPNIDKVDKTIESLVAFKDTKDGYKMKALDECTSRINAALEACILNRTSQLPFKVQNKDGILRIDLPRKYFEWQVKEVQFKIKE